MSKHWTTALIVASLLPAAGLAFGPVAAAAAPATGAATTPVPHGVVASSAVVAVAAARASPASDPLAAAAVTATIATTGAVPTPVALSSTRRDPHPAPGIGVNVDLRRHGTVERLAVLRRLAQAGIRQVRQPVSWPDLEPAPGAAEWTALEELLDDFHAHDMRVVLAVGESPAWSRHDGPRPEHLWLCDDPAVTGPDAARFGPPTDPAALASFAARLAGKFQHRLWALEVWPEPNLLPNWRATGPDPEEYGALLVAVADAVRSAAPDVLVVAGGLAPTTDVGVCYLSDVVFLDRLARMGALEAVDAIAIEPFGLRDGPAARPHREQLNFRRAEVLQDVLVRHGVRRPVWAVAWGWNGRPARSQGPISPHGGHPPAQAADWMREGYALARDDWPWLAETFLWHLQPTAAPEDPEWGFALLDPQGQPTMLWAAAADLAAGRLPQPPVVQSESLLSPRLAALLLVAVLGVAALALRRRLAPPLSALLQQIKRRSTLQLGTWYAAAVLGNALLPWPASLVTVPVLATVATASPVVALVAVAVVTPFYYGLDLWLGPLALDGIEFLVLMAVAGRAAAWYASPVGWPRHSAAATGRREPWRAAGRRLALLHWADGLVAALIAWSALSILWSEFREPAFRQWRTVLLEPALFYALLRWQSNRRVIARLALDGLVAGGVLAALWGLAALALLLGGWGGAGVGAEGVVRAVGPYASPNNLALYLGRMVPVAAVFALWSTGRRRTLYRWATPILLAGLVATFSRGALLVGLPVLALYLGAVALRQADRRRLLTLGAAGAGLALALLPFADTERLKGALRFTPGGTGHIRLRLWQSALAMGEDHPWAGVGLDNFLYLYRDRYVQRDAVQERFLNHPHNWLLDWWTRLGLVGLALYAGLLWANLQAGLAGWRRIGATRLLAAAALGMQLYAVSHGLVDNSFFLVDLAVVWWVGQAALLASGTAGSGTESEPS